MKKREKIYIEYRKFRKKANNISMKGIVELYHLPPLPKGQSGVEGFKFLDKIIDSIKK